MSLHQVTAPHASSFPTHPLPHLGFRQKKSHLAPLLPTAHLEEEPLISRSRIKPPRKQFCCQNEGIMKKDLERTNIFKEDKQETA